MIDSAQMQWFNPAPQWQHQDHAVTITTAPKTDFWRQTHYSFTRDSGHFYYQKVSGDFSVEVKFTGQYNFLYDQAGLMLRQDEQNWLKCGIEFVDGVQQVSAVVTRDFSDWSVLALPQNPPSVWLRLVRKGGAVEIFYSLDGQLFTMYRMTYLSTSPTLKVGLMCASPDGPGFTTVFESYRVQSL